MIDTDMIDTDVIDTDVIDTDTVRSAGELVDLPLTDDQCLDLLPLVRHWAVLGSELLDATTTDLLPTDCPRWPAP